MRQPTESKRQVEPSARAKAEQGRVAALRSQGLDHIERVCGSSMSRPAASPATVGASNRARRVCSAGPHSRRSSLTPQVRHNWCVASPRSRRPPDIVESLCAKD